MQHVANNNYQDGRGAESQYRNRFTCLRSTVRWRPRIGFHSIDTRIYGVQTATVTGPKNEEIFTDEFGRIRLQFQWDRLGEYDEKSSPWVRVMSNWAGSGFGQISLPRIGQEVVVQFLNGCCDRPLVIGSVYNAANMPPWDLPDNRTQSGILTRSTINGTVDNANALRFEDRKGEEEVWLHAEKDQRIEVEHDESHTVGNDRSKSIGHDETTSVTHDRTETVGNDEKISVHGSRTEQVDHDEQIGVGGDRTEKVAGHEKITIVKSKSELVILSKQETIVLAKILMVGGVYSVDVGESMTTKVIQSQFEDIGDGKQTKVKTDYAIEAGNSFEIKVGAASLKMTSDGAITMSGATININASGPVQINGKDVDIN